VTHTVTVVSVIRGTVVNEAHTADRVSAQIWDSGRARVEMVRGDTTEVIIYRRAERIHHTKPSKDA
jgi:hypothetical protein